MSHTNLKFPNPNGFLIFEVGDRGGITISKAVNMSAIQWRTPSRCQQVSELPVQPARSSLRDKMSAIFLRDNMITLGKTAKKTPGIQKNPSIAFLNLIDLRQDKISHI